MVRVRERINGNSVLVGQTEGRRSLKKKTTCRWEDNTKMYIK